MKLILIILMGFCYCKGQNTLFEIQNDFVLVNHLHGFNLYMNGAKNQEDSSFLIEIIKSDTFPCEQNYKFSIIKLKVSVNEPKAIDAIHLHSFNKIDTLEFYYLCDFACVKKYKLFGFYNSNILTFFNETFEAPKQKKAMKKLGNYLVENKILTKKQGNIFVRNIIQQDFNFSEKLQKPVQFMSVFKLKKHSNTIISPYLIPRHY